MKVLCGCISQNILFFYSEWKICTVSEISTFEYFMITHLLNFIVTINSQFTMHYYKNHTELLIPWHIGSHTLKSLTRSILIGTS